MVCCIPCCKKFDANDGEGGGTGAGAGLIPESLGGITGAAPSSASVPPACIASGVAGVGDPPVGTATVGAPTPVVGIPAVGTVGAEGVGNKTSSGFAPAFCGCFFFFFC